ncbi:MAG: 2-isopropylmalate synthase [Eubacteriales bacterium]|nr:2-isopropylmalate synthase [Eubacteriales bacterium]
MSRLTYDTHSNLLKENYYTYTVQDVPEPNLFPDFFDYEQIPRVAFNQRLVPMHMPEEIFITDTTFRDGQQSREPFTPKQIAQIYTYLHRLSGPHGVVRQCEFFVYSEQDRRAIELCRLKGYKFPEITTWIRATEKDFDLVKELGVSETGILVSCSDYHIFKKLNMTRKQAMDQYLGVVKMALDRGIRPRCHFEDITRADFYGFVVPFAHALHELSEDAGIPIKIRCCDTLGLGVSYPGASLPRSVPGIIYGLRHYANVNSTLLEWHGHNDFYKVVTNAASAWLYGASAVNCSLLGIGERTGNCPLEAMVMEYCSLRGRSDDMELSVLTELADYFTNEIGYDIPPQTPFMGRDFCSTRAGIHADGLQKDERIYSIFDTGAILNRPNVVKVDAHSGLAGIAYWMNLNHALPRDVQKGDPLVAAVKEKVDAHYNAGRTTALSDAEMQAICAAVMGESAPSRE